MKVAVVIVSAILAVVSAKPSQYLLASPNAAYLPTVAHSTIIAPAGPLLRQFHSQDVLGQYSYGYDGGPSAKTETRTWDGVTRGSYSYVDPENKLQSIAYTADAANGFRVAATNLPVAPIDSNKAPEQIMETPEVMAARAEHLRLIEESKNRPATPELILRNDAPLPVEETAEVMAARAEHLRLYEESKTRAELAPEVFDQILISEAPKQIEETAEVKLARAQHLSMIEESKRRAEMAPSTLEHILLKEAPKQIEETAEVMAARAEHLRLYEESKNRPATPENILLKDAPKQIEETPEVMAARADHLRAIEEQKKRIEAAPQGLKTVELARDALTFAPAQAWAAPAIQTYAAPTIQTYAAPAFQTYAAPAIAAAPSVAIKAASLPAVTFKTAELPAAHTYSIAAPHYAYSINAPAYLHQAQAYTAIGAPVLAHHAYAAPAAWIEAKEQKA